VRDRPLAGVESAISGWQALGRCRDECEGADGDDGSKASGPRQDWRPHPL